MNTHETIYDLVVRVMDRLTVAKALNGHSLQTFAELEISTTNFERECAHCADPYGKHAHLDEWCWDYATQQWSTTMHFQPKYGQCESIDAFDNHCPRIGAYRIKDDQIMCEWCYRGVSVQPFGPALED